MKLILKGAIIGVSMLIPGVSGGNAAIVLGVYDKMIIAVASFFKAPKKNAVFLIKLITGAFFAIIAFSRLLSAVMDRYEKQATVLFCIFTLCGIPFFIKSAGISRVRLRHIASAAATALILIAASSIDFAVKDFTVSGLTVFFAGVILSAALILPGISFSYMLLCMNMYTAALNAVNGRDYAFLLPLAAGIFIGTVAFAKLFEFLLSKYRDVCYIVITIFLLQTIFTSASQMLSL